MPPNTAVDKCAGDAFLGIGTDLGHVSACQLSNY